MTPEAISDRSLLPTPGRDDEERAHHEADRRTGRAAFDEASPLRFARGGLLERLHVVDLIGRTSTSTRPARNGRGTPSKRSLVDDVLRHGDGAVP